MSVRGPLARPLLVLHDITSAIVLLFFFFLLLLIFFISLYRILHE